MKLGISLLMSLLTSRWFFLFLCFVLVSLTTAIRNAIFLGGDADTIVCITDGIAVTTKDMNMPENLAHCIYKKVLDDYLRQVPDDFNQYLKDNERT